MAGHPDRNLSVRCAVSQSERATCEKSQRGSPTATNSATSITVMFPSWRSQITRGRNDSRRRFKIRAANGSRPIGGGGAAAKCQNPFALANELAVGAIVGEKVSLAPAGCRRKAGSEVEGVAQMQPTDPASRVPTDQLTQALGEAVIRLWSSLPQDVQDHLFKGAVASQGESIR